MHIHYCCLPSVYTLVQLLRVLDIAELHHKENGRNMTRCMGRAPELAVCTEITDVTRILIK
jgi:hypothetical protein